MTQNCWNCSFRLKRMLLLLFQRQCRTELNRFALWGSLNLMWSVASDYDRGSACDPENDHENARETCH